MFLRQSNSIHTNGQHGSRFESFIQVDAIAVVVGCIKDDLDCPWFNPCTLQQSPQGNAFPESITHVFTADLVADTHHGLILLLHRQREQILVSKCKGMLNIPIDGKLPGTSLNDGVGEEVLGDDVELVIRADLR